MSEGTVVIVAAKMDERVRDQIETEIRGTVVKLERDKVWVMLPGGDLWVGDSYKVYPVQEEETCTTN